MSKYILSKIKSKKLSIGIIGLGYVGLPLAIRFLDKNFDVQGVETDNNKINLIKRGTCYIENKKFGKNAQFKKFFKSVSSDYSKLKNVDIIVCNPPYIPTSNYLSLNNETLYDPRISLDGGELGIDYYVKIIDHLINVKFKGSLYFEIDPIITENMYKYLLEKGIKIVYKKVDYLSLDRLIKITLPNTN